MKIMARTPESRDSDVQSTLFQLLRHPELSIDLGLSACRFLNASNRFLLCERGLDELLARYAGSSNLARIHVERLQSALHRLTDDEALPYVKTFINDHDVMSSMNEDAMRLIHMILWEQAEKHQERGNTDQVLAWYTMSLNLFGAFRNKSSELNTELILNMAKVNRNRCSCLILLDRLDEAKQAAKEAEKLDSDNPRTHFALFKVALAEGNRVEAIKAADNIEKHRKQKTVVGAEHLRNNNEGNIEETTVQGFIYLAAQMAFEKRERAIAIAALRHIATCSDNRMTKLLALRCLVRLYLSVIEEGDDRLCESSADAVGTCTDPETELMKLNNKDLVAKSVRHIESALQVFEDISNNPLQDFEVASRQEANNQGRQWANNDGIILDETTWFMKISWNIAIECKHEAEHVKKAFQLCHMFLSFLPAKESDDFARQRTCILMSCAASLEIARKSYDRKTIENNLRSVLDLVRQYKPVCDGITDSRGTDATESDILIALYEFEACAKLTPPRARGMDASVCVLITELEQLIEKIKALPNATVKTFETIAALCLDPPARHVSLSKKALKIAIRKLDGELLRNSADEEQRKQHAETYSKLYHSLVDLALAEGSAINPASKEEAWCYVNEVFCVVDGKLKRYYPELEILWLTIKVWNVGARLFAADHVNESEKWCAGAMRFLTHLKHFKSSYESHMNEVYQEILMKKDVMAAKQNPSDMY